jgi:hypothetical protein
MGTLHSGGQAKELKKAHAHECVCTTDISVLLCKNQESPAQAFLLPQPAGQSMQMHT